VVVECSDALQAIHPLKKKKHGGTHEKRVALVALDTISLDFTKR